MHRKHKPHCSERSMDIWKKYKSTIFLRIDTKLGFRGGILVLW